MSKPILKTIQNQTYSGCYSKKNTLKRQKKNKKPTFLFFFGEELSFLDIVAFRRSIQDKPIKSFERFERNPRGIHYPYYSHCASIP